MIPEHIIPVFVSPEKELIFLSKSANPNYNEDVEIKRQQEWDLKCKEAIRLTGRGLAPTPPDQEPPYLTSKFSIALSYPYTAEEVAQAFQTAVAAWDRYPIYPETTRDPIELYLGTKNFRKTTLDWKWIHAFIGDGAIPCAILSLPTKTHRVWISVNRINLPSGASWLDFAEAIIELATSDFTQYDGFKTFKSRLNVTVAAPRKRKQAAGATNNAE